MSSVISRNLKVMMSFDNGSKLRFFSTPSPSNDFAISIAQSFTIFLPLSVASFFLEHRKATLHDACNNGLSIGKNPRFLSYHSNESVPF